MRKSFLILGTALLITTLIAVMMIMAHRTGEQHISQGQVRASTYSYEDFPVIPLTGTWEFYPQQLLTSEQLETVRKPGDLGGTYIDVPSLWDEHMPDEDASGYGTYRILLELPPGRTFALGLKSIYTSYTLFINGEQTYRVGEPSEISSTYQPAFLPSVISFASGSGNVELIFHVANFNHAKGGILQEVILGRPEIISRIFSLETGITLFLAGLLVLTGLFMVTFYGSENSNSGLLYFAAFCMLIALRATMDGTVAFMQLLPGTPYVFHMKIEYLTISIGLFCFAFYSERAFPYALDRMSSMIVGIPSIAYTLLIILAPAALFTSQLTLFGLVIGFYGLYWVVQMLRSHLKKEADSFIPMVGGLVLLITVINDLIYYTNLSESLFHLTIDLTPIGLLFFVLTHSFDFSLQYFNALKAAKEFTGRLEKKVQQRTVELEQLNERLLTMATVDELTGVRNRAALEQRSEEEHKSGKSGPYSILYADLDNFKYYNDTYSHDAGDMILETFSRLLKDLCIAFGQTGDEVFRMGGDEFVILLPDRDQQGAQRCAGRILGSLPGMNEQIVGRLSISYPEKPAVPREEYISCSIGIATHLSGPINIGYLIRQADKGLLEAKAAGKNRYLQIL
jgi:diguanylate cyclase (GGDEF)-like protein